LTTDYYNRLVAEIREFLRLEAASGLLLMAAALLALLASNSPAAGLYDGFLALPLEFRIGAFGLGKPLLLWINDGLMAIFFLLVGLEIKRELVAGELSTRAQAALPAVAALGGMVAPAAIYLAINPAAPASAGWAVPAATDIAFALAALALVGRRAPASLKVFLLALAILDDLGAIVIIAIFYAGDLDLLALGLAAIPIAGLVALNRFGVRRLAPYLLLGVALWLCVLQSGVHATLAGVATALAIPRRADGAGTSAAGRLEHRLHPWVAFLIMPLFGFANAGVSLAGVGPAALGGGVSLGIVAGLFLGKQFGVFGAAWLAVRLGLARWPEGASALGLYGTAALAGIGFTMSLFIGTLAWPAADFAAPLRLGVLGGSLLSGVYGYLILKLGNPATGHTSGR